MKTQTCVIHHHDCSDGCGAASWVAYRKLGQEGVEYVPCAHGDPPPEMEPGSRVYILDFAFPGEVMLDLMEGRDALLIDHHRTADQEIGDLPGCHLVMDRSGAVLAWQWFHPGSAIPELLLYMEDWDLWQWKLPRSREVSAALDCHPKDSAHGTGWRPET